MLVVALDVVMLESSVAGLGVTVVSLMAIVNVVVALDEVADSGSVVGVKSLMAIVRVVVFLRSTISGAVMESLMLSFDTASAGLWSPVLILFCCWTARLLVVS